MSRRSARSPTLRKAFQKYAKVAYHEAILEAAERVFLRDGYHEAKMADIAAEAGVSVGTLYNYFTSKELVFASIVERGKADLAEALVETAKVGDPLERLRAVVEVGLRFIEERGALFALYTQLGLMTESDIKRVGGAQAEQAYLEHVQALADIIALAQNARQHTRRRGSPGAGVCARRHQQRVRLQLAPRRAPGKPGRTSGEHPLDLPPRSTATMSERRGIALVFAAALLAFSCKSANGKGDLPPPTGSGTPAPEIPALAASDSPGGAGESTTDAPGHFSGTGTLVSEHQAELGPKSSGVITRITVDEGDHVKKGQLLFSLDSAQAQIAARQAKAAVAAAQVGVDSAELDFKRTKELFDRGSVAPATFDQVKARYDGAKANLDQAKAALSMAYRNASDASVRSPIDGVVTNKLKNVGETATMMPPTVILVVQDLDSLELRARLPERALSSIKTGAQVRMHLPATGADRVVEIKRINPAIDARTRTIEVVALVKNKDHALKPGMLAEVSYDLPDAGAKAKAK